MITGLELKWVSWVRQDSRTSLRVAGTTDRYSDKNCREVKTRKDIPVQDSLCTDPVTSRLMVALKATDGIDKRNEGKGSPGRARTADLVINSSKNILNTGRRAQDS
jgi:hypothetical protein